MFLGELAQSATPAHAWRAQVMLVPSESQWWADTVGEHFAPGPIAGLDALAIGPFILAK